MNFESVLKKFEKKPERYKRIFDDLFMEDKLTDLGKKELEKRLEKVKKLYQLEIYTNLEYLIRNNNSLNWLDHLENLINMKLNPSECGNCVEFGEDLLSRLNEMVDILKDIEDKNEWKEGYKIQRFSENYSVEYREKLLLVQEELKKQIEPEIKKILEDIYNLATKIDSSSLLAGEYLNKCIKYTKEKNKEELMKVKTIFSVSHLLWSIDIANDQEFEKKLNKKGTKVKIIRMGGSRKVEIQ